MSLYLDAAVYHTHTRQYDAPAVPGTGLFYCEGQFKKVTGDAEMAQVIAALEAEHAERNRFRRRRQRETTRGGLSENFQRTYCKLRQLFHAAELSA